MKDFNSYQTIACEGSLGNLIERPFYKKEAKKIIVEVLNKVSKKDGSISEDDECSILYEKLHSMWALMSESCGITGAAGSFANHLNQHVEDEQKFNREVMIRILGEILRHVARAAHELDIELNDVANRDLQRLHEEMKYINSENTRYMDACRETRCFNDDTEPFQTVD